MPATGIAGQILGLSPNTASSLGGVIRTGLSAAGTVITDATDLTGAINLVNTATAGQGVQLPVVGNNDSVLVFNDATGVSFKVYPEASTSTINQVAAGGAVLLGTNTAMLFVKISATRWVAFLSA